MSDAQTMSSATDERKTCIDCELFDTMAGNIYGVCIADSHINGDGEFCLQWVSAGAAPCERFGEVRP